MHSEQKISELDININAPKTDNSFSLFALIIATSVLLGAVLISVSVFYNAKLVLKKIDTVVESLQQTQVAISAIQVGQGTGDAQKPDPNAVVKVTDREDAPFLGNKNAKVIVYEFSDVQCPFCQRFFSQTFAKLKSTYIDTGKIKFVYRHLPLTSLHQNAQKAAEALECASRQGKFGAYHDLIFAKAQPDGTGLANKDLKAYADSLNLNTGTLGFGKNKFNNCLDNSETAEVIKADLNTATSVGAQGTPTFFINGKKVVGAQPFESFQTEIEAALKK